MEQLFFAGKAYLKINSLVKTPLDEFMAVERSGLWPPDGLNFTFLSFKFIIKTAKNKILAKDKFESQHVYYRKKLQKNFLGEVLLSKYTVVFCKLAHQSMVPH